MGTTGKNQKNVEGRFWVRGMCAVVSQASVQAGKGVVC